MKELMTFEADGMKFTQPLDPYQGPHYMDMVEGNMEKDALDHLYTLNIGKRADYINLTAYNLVRWHSVKSTGEDSEVSFDSWK
jgi:hypothetical protein